MKKVLGIVVLVLFFTGSANALTLYCDNEQWNYYITLNIDYENKTVQGPTFKGGKKFNATISNKKIIFDAESEKWEINRNTGEIIRDFGNIQKGQCSTKKPKQKF